MTELIDNLTEKAKEKPKRIVLPEGEGERIQTVGEAVDYIEKKLKEKNSSRKD